MLEHEKEKPHIKYYWDLLQHTDEWRDVRRGILTASEVKNIITPAKLQYASNDKERTHLYQIAAERLTTCTEPTYQNDDMSRGIFDEIDAAQIYNKNYGELMRCGFVKNDIWGFPLGYSPDALTKCGNGQIEIKSRRMKYQVETICIDQMPPEYLIQVQTGLIVTERQWCDFVSFCGGMPMYVKRVYMDDRIRQAITDAAFEFHRRLDDVILRFKQSVEKGNFINTVRRSEEIEI